MNKYGFAPERRKIGSITSEEAGDKLKWVEIFVNKHADKIGKTVEDFDLETLSISEASRALWCLNLKSRKKINDKNGDRFDTSLLVNGLQELVKICGEGVTRVAKEEDIVKRAGMGN